MLEQALDSSIDEPYLYIDNIIITEEDHIWKVSAEYRCNPINSVEELSGKILLQLDILLPMTTDDLRSHLRSVVSNQIKQAWLKAETAQKKS